MDVWPINPSLSSVMPKYNSMAFITSSTVHYASWEVCTSFNWPVRALQLKEVPPFPPSPPPRRRTDDLKSEGWDTQCYCNCLNVAVHLTSPPPALTWNSRFWVWRSYNYTFRLRIPIIVSDGRAPKFPSEHRRERESAIHSTPPPLKKETLENGSGASST